MLNLFTSFGFFAEPADDRKVLSEFARVLEPGGVLVWHGGSRDGVMARFLERDWWQTKDGTLIGHERSFDPLSGKLTVDEQPRKRARVVRAQRVRQSPTRYSPVYSDALGRIMR